MTSRQILLFSGPPILYIHSMKCERDGCDEPVTVLKSGRGESPFCEEHLGLEIARHEEFRERQKQLGELRDELKTWESYLAGLRKGVRSAERYRLAVVRELEELGDD